MMQKMCALFYQRIPYEFVQQEYENAKKLMGLGICVPELFEVIERDGRYGIIYEKIHGKPIWAYMDRECVFERFITGHKKLLGVSTDTLIPHQDILITMIRGGDSKEIEEEFVIVDLWNVCCGPKEYDDARTYFLLESEQWRDRYLAGMGYDREEIGSYLELIGKIQKYE